MPRRSPFSTPGQKTIDDLVKFTGEPGNRMIKTLVYVVDGQAILILLRGDHTPERNEAGGALGTDAFRPCDAGRGAGVAGGAPGVAGSGGIERGQDSC